MDESSILKQAVQPNLQLLLVSAGGFGNEKVTIGDNGWLYYTPGLRYIFGHPFLDPHHLKAKAKAMIDKEGLAVAHPDPLPAFRQLAEDCRRLRIQLVFLPVPDKGMIVPRHLSQGGAGGAFQNPDFSRFRIEMETLGAQVIAVESMVETADAPWFLQRDTHWTPRFMDRVARGLAHRIQIRSPNDAPRFRLKPRVITSHGDLVSMLKLPGGQTTFPPDTVEVDEVEPVSIHSSLPEPSVLLLGDSFTNIYSSQSLSWGERAGLGEHLAYHLNEPVDIIAMNGGGASVRQELLRAARAGRLARTRTLVYEFAVRDLYLENWPPVPLGHVHRASATPISEAKPKPTHQPVPVPPLDLTVTGTITQLSRPIDPIAAPYEDALLYGKISVESVDTGKYDSPEAIIVFLAMKDRKLLPGAAHRVGDKIRLKLIPLKSAPPSVRAMQRSDDTEDFDLVPLFVLAELPPPGRKPR